jgi:hypothetical protein
MALDIMGIETKKTAPAVLLIDYLMKKIFVF